MTYDEMITKMREVERLDRGGDPMDRINPIMAEIEDLDNAVAGEWLSNYEETIDEVLNRLPETMLFEVYTAMNAGH